MKTPQEVQAALDTLVKLKKDPAMLKYAAPSPEFEAQLPGMVAALRWINEEGERTLPQVHAGVVREFERKR
jgi:hypothetical protein